MNNFFKYCPGCGQSTIKRVEDKRFYCDSCKFVYYHNVAAAVAGIIETDEGILFTVRKHAPCLGKLDLPGGFVDYHETAEDGLKREIKEELNIELSQLKYLCTTYNNQYLYKSINYHTLDLIFICHAKSLDNIIPQDDIMDYHFVKRCQINFDMISFDSIRDAVQTYLTKC